MLPLTHKTGRLPISLPSTCIAAVVLFTSLVFTQTSIGQDNKPQGDKTPKPDATTKNGSQQSNRVIVKPVQKPFEFEECGSVLWSVFLELERPTKTGGYIIQEIEVTEKFRYCYSKSTITSKPVHFWEAWRVNPGEKIPAGRKPRKFKMYERRGSKEPPPLERIKVVEVEGDDFYMHSNPGRAGKRFYATKGKLAVRGWVRFYEGVELPKTFKGANSKAKSGGLLSSVKKPPFWNRDSAAEHHLFWEWDCCGEEKKEPVYKTIPKVEDKPKPSTRLNDSGSQRAEGQPQTDGKPGKDNETKKSNTGNGGTPSENKPQTDQKEKPKTRDRRGSSRLAEPSQTFCCGGSSSTAIAEAVLPAGTQVVTAPVIAGSEVKFNEPGTVYLATASAVAEAEQEPSEDTAEPGSSPTLNPGMQIVPTRVKPGDRIPSDRLVAALLDNGLGIISSRVSQPSRITVHTGRDAIIHDPAERSRTNSNGENETSLQPVPDPISDSDAKDDMSEYFPNETEQQPAAELPVNNGSFTASILTDLPYLKSAVGTSARSQLASQTHVEILVDGRKQGEVATFSNVDPHVFRNEPMRFQTLNDDNRIVREGTFQGTVADVGLKVHFDKAVYRLGDEGFLLIRNQHKFRQAQLRNRIGGAADANNWLLNIETSESLAGIPKQAPFATHRLPFTVVNKGQLRATVQAELRDRPDKNDPRTSEDDADDADSSLTEDYPIEEIGQDGTKTGENKNRLRSTTKNPACLFQRIWWTATSTRMAPKILAVRSQWYQASHYLDEKGYSRQRLVKVKPGEKPKTWRYKEIRIEIDIEYEVYTERTEIWAWTCGHNHSPPWRNTYTDKETIKKTIKKRHNAKYGEVKAKDDVEKAIEKTKKWIKETYYPRRFRYGNSRNPRDYGPERGHRKTPQVY